MLIRDGYTEPSKKPGTRINGNGTIKIEIQRGSFDIRR